MLIIDLILTRPWEAVAVALGIAYVVLATRENVWCWPAALVSTAIFSWLFWDVSLLMESGLNVYYLFMAVYGWSQWTGGSKDHSPQKIHSWNKKQHLISISLILIFTIVSGLLLSRYTQAALPFLDSLTTWAAVVTTYMVTRKVLENWLYWVVIDSVSVYLYLDRALYMTSALFFAYIVISIYGWYSWKRIFDETTS
jgi:nicotinamide mononucleotide transporter